MPTEKRRTAASETRKTKVSGNEELGGNDRENAVYCIAIPSSLFSQSDHQTQFSARNRQSMGYVRVKTNPLQKLMREGNNTFTESKMQTTGTSRAIISQIAR